MGDDFNFGPEQVDDFQFAPTEESLQRYEKRSDLRREVHFAKLFLAILSILSLSAAIASLWWAFIIPTWTLVVLASTLGLHCLMVERWPVVSATIGVCIIAYSFAIEGLWQPDVVLLGLLPKAGTLLVIAVSTHSGCKYVRTSSRND